MDRIRSVILTSVLLLGSTGAMAQQAVVRQACGAELQQHCAGVQPGGGRLRSCVKEHFTEFSEPCKQALKACKADVQKTCAGVQPGGGRIQACMKDHFAEYSETCRQAIITAKFGSR